MQLTCLGEFMRMAKDIVGKPFGFLPFLRFIPPYRQRFLELSQCIEGRAQKTTICNHLHIYFKISNSFSRQPLLSTRRVLTGTTLVTLLTCSSSKQRMTPEGSTPGSSFSIFVINLIGKLLLHGLHAAAVRRRTPIPMNIWTETNCPYNSAK